MTAPSPTPPMRWSGAYPAAARAGKLRRRHAINAVMAGLVGLAAILATLPLVIVLFYLLKQGATSLQWHFFTNMPKPVGESGGGMANAIVGTLMLIGTASAIGLPVGIGAGLYLAEHRGSRLANTTRFLADVLNGLPSIVMGIFAWQILVRPVGHFSAWAGGVALAAMMIPQVARTTEEIVRTVPVSLREAALALGYARWRTSLTVVLRTATAGSGHRRTRGDRAYRGRDGTASLHGVRQPVLVHVAQPAGRRAPAADLYLRAEPLRRLAFAGMGRRTRPHCPHPHYQPRRPCRDPGPIRDRE